MILKEKDTFTGSDKRLQYGHQQEKDVAFHLRREFGDKQQVLIFNDLRLTHNGENAQIDHLVVYPFGFIVIESKSINGEVNVNTEGEWSRSYRGEWRGMPSPVRQAEMQQTLLKELLRANVEKFVRKLLGVQGQVGGREWRVLCAVSSSAILDRENMPSKISDVTVKSEFVAERVKKWVGSLGTFSSLKGRARFNERELADLGDFLLTQDAQARQTVPPPEIKAPVVVPETSVQETAVPLLVCKHCGEDHALEDRYGKYGYFVKCGSCGKNTPMKPPCPACDSRSVVVNKRGPTYAATCKACQHQFVLFQAAVAEPVQCIETSK
ncbi:NERD domain-containing protein [Vreelandella rituensis]|uniref:NERD domain-containing protein n=1 Tax=Vreelandella rituensis TaxID=2282306 RepID=A0A368TYW2_9GAMM|nr:NERD domain-containing protein [Halomonas rituensis]RCV89042.1 hypothetical protein DU506_13515 [Halomonas rituensis]